MNRFVLLVVFAILFCAPLLPSSSALAPAPCASAAVARQEAKTRLLAYAKLKQRKHMYCGKAKNGGRWGWIDNGAMVSISVTAIRDPAARVCYYMLTHSAADASIFFGTRRAPGRPYSDADFQVNLKRAKGYRAKGQPVNWHHGEIVAARFLSQYEAPTASVTVYPKPAKAAALALRPKLAINGGTYEVVGVYPDRPFCAKCAGTDDAYKGNVAVVPGALMPIANAAACTAANAALGKVAAVTTANNQISQAEMAVLNHDARAYKVGLNEGLCCDWEARGRRGPDPANCYPPAPQPVQDDDVDMEDDTDEIVCKKRKFTCDSNTGSRKKDSRRGGLTQAFFFFKSRREVQANDELSLEAGNTSP